MVKAERQLEVKGKVISFEDRVVSAHERADSKVLSDKLAEALPAAMQLAAFEEDDMEVDSGVEALWEQKVADRLAA